MMTFWEGAYKACGSFEADCMFLAVEGACAQALIIREIARLANCISKPVFGMHMGFQSILKVGKSIRLGMGEEELGVLGLVSSRASQAIL
eukprot:1138766-Pelagomonas_calceolata.AAC.2